MPEPTVACECCHGIGERKLHPGEARTFDAVPARWTDTKEIGRALAGIRHESLCNQLVRLLAVGLVDRRNHPTNARASQWRRSTHGARAARVTEDLDRRIQFARRLLTEIEAA